MARDSIAKQKSLEFAKRVIRLYQFLQKEHHEFVMSKQILRSGTSIGANIAEAMYGSSRKDFVAKLQIAQKEAAETQYWLELLHDSGYLKTNLFQSFWRDCDELISILAASIKTTKLD